MLPTNSSALLVAIADTDASTSTEQGPSDSTKAILLSSISLGVAGISFVIAVFLFIRYTSFTRSPVVVFRKKQDEDDDDPETAYFRPGILPGMFLKIRAFRFLPSWQFARNGIRLPMGHTDGSPASQLALVYTILWNMSHVDTHIALHISYLERIDNLMHEWLEASVPSHREWILSSLDVLVNENIVSHSRTRTLEALWSSYASWKGGKIVA